MEMFSNILDWGAKAILVYITGSFFKHIYDTKKGKDNQSENNKGR